VAILFAAMARAEDKPTCTAGIFGAGQVQAVPDGRTVRLSDGRTVRLAGIEVSQPDEADSRANNAKLALEHLVFNRPITLMRLGPETDRHGRVVALVALPSLHPARLSSTRCWRRHARVAANIGDFACAASLLAAEKPARTGGLGRWANPYYVMRNAEVPQGFSRFGAALPWLRGRFCRSARAAAQFA
jgi:hypothetical protein